jgi:hypothetical protein
LAAVLVFWCFGSSWIIQELKEFKKKRR